MNLQRAVGRTVSSSFLVLVCALMAVSSCGVLGWTSTSQNTFKARSTGRRGGITMYMPPSGPVSQPPSFTAQKMLHNKNTVITPARPQQASSKVQLSNSVLASCDTLPSFPTAHGLLSPETVMRLEELTPTNRRSEALRGFLDTYRRHGPLSCLPMLSDPDVLPHLTEAMRDIAA